MKILVINAAADNRGKTYKLYEAIRDKYLTNCEIVEHKLLDYNVPYLTGEMYEQHREINNKFLEEYLEFDRIIFIYPTYNWSVPATLKAYIDMVLKYRVVFKMGLKGQFTTKLNDKKILLINTSGGNDNEANEYMEKVSGLMAGQHELVKIMNADIIYRIDKIYDLEVKNKVSNLDLDFFK